MKFNLPKRLLLFSFILLTFAPVFPQNIKYERERHRGMLMRIKDEVKKNYYDAGFRGIDLEANYKAAIEKINQAESIGHMNAIIAQFLLDFDDSHLFFIPPGKANKTEYGFEMQMVGNKCFVVEVEPKSDAEKKGLQVGDEIYSMETFNPTRETLWKMKYFYYSLRPQPVLRLEITKPDGKEIFLEVEAKITTGRKLIGTNLSDWQDYDRKAEDAYHKARKQGYYDKIDGLFIWKMPSFNLTPANVDDILGRIRGKNSALILDLRGNGGGRVDMLLRLISNIFPENVKVADEKQRKSAKEIIAKTRGKDVFNGKLMVLIDSESGSASEVFAKVVQLEKRGTVIGDQSAGAVMESKFYPQQIGVNIVAFYGISITVADLIMKDGKSLEKIGVIPDEKILPTAQDLAGKRDPVLARAVESLGFKMSAEEAGKIFPKDDKK